MLFGTVHGKYQKDKPIQLDKKKCLAISQSTESISMQACENLNIQTSFRCHKKHKFVSVLFAQLKFAEAPVFIPFFSFVAVCETSIK